MKDADPPRPPAHLELAKARLSVEDGELVRRGESGAVVTRIPLDDLEGAAFRRHFNTFTVAPVLLGGGFAALAYYVSEYNVVSVLLYAAAMMLGVFALFGLWTDTVEVRHGGAVLRIDCGDPTDDVRGFAASLGRLVRRD